MSAPMRWEITVALRSPKGWGGYRAIVLGDGVEISAALKDASNIIGSAYRPKQDGRVQIQLNVTIERPDGTRFNVHPDKLKECFCAADLEAARS